MSQKSAPEPLGNAPIQQDLGFYALVGLVGLVAVWLLAMPLVPTVAEATMRRFHLTTESFSLWSLQQLIPSMYNFDNRFEVQRQPPDSGDPIFHSLSPWERIAARERVKSGQVNHFPASRITSALAHTTYSGDLGDRWFTLITSYRGIEEKSYYHLQPREDGGFEMIRLERGFADEHHD